MDLWRYAFDEPSRPNPSTVARAASATLVVPTSLALLYLWLIPGGCAMGLDATVYRWTCLLPGLLVVVPIAAAIALSAIALLNRQFVRRLRGGWFATVVGFALFTQAVAVVSYLLALDPAYRGAMVWELLSAPQPFTAGAIASGFFWFVLHPTTIIRR